MINFPKRPDREVKPQLIFNTWIKQYYEDRLAIVKAVMLALYLTNYHKVPVSTYYDTLGNQKFQVEFDYDMTGDSTYDKTMELAELFYEEYLQHNYTDSLNVYIFLNILLYLDENVCRVEFKSLLRQRMNFFHALPPLPKWMISLANKLGLSI